MDITAELDTIRAELDGCALVAFTDLTSQLVLCSSAAAKTAQEDMNALSEAAAIALDGAFAEGAAPVWGGESPAALAVLATGTEVRLFLRAPARPGEALVCVCSPEADLGNTVARAREALDRIVAGS